MDELEREVFVAGYAVITFCPSPDDIGLLEGTELGSNDELDDELELDDESGTAFSCGRIGLGQ